MRPISRRHFLGTSAALAAAATLTPRRLFAASDAVTEVIPWKAQPFPMQQVRLLYGPFKEAQERNRVYLFMLPNDRLLHSFRITAGLPSTAQSLGGWELPTGELRGHLTGGHYLSACALMYASTGDEALRVKALNLVEELARCQQPNGYLGAYPENFYDRLRAYKDVWAPFYTYHKILAGHIDMHVHCASDTALKTATRMADWAINWIGPLTDEELARIQLVEHGGMNEALFNLYAITGEKKYLAAGLRFEHKKFFDPLAAQEDKLAGLHSNTNIPKVIGAARGYELTGSERYHTIAEFFWSTVVDHHTFAAGGTSNATEGWSAPDTAGAHLEAAGQECCCSYNMLKLTRHLFGWNPESRRMDYYERLLWNVRMGTQSPEGMLMYYVPTAAGAWKTFGSQFDSNWCCTGSGIEEYSKLNDTLYFHDDDSIYVNHFAASYVQWPEKNLLMEQHTFFPEEEKTTLLVHTTQPSVFTMRLRKPGWAEDVQVTINGRAVSFATAGDGYIAIQRTWHEGDRIEMTLPMKLRELSVPGSPDLAAVAYGPLTLAASMGREGLTRRLIENYEGPDMKKLPMLAMPHIQRKAGEMWVDKLPGAALAFETRGQTESTRLKPMYMVLDERYSTYFQINEQAKG
jgi:DUF1680 family protein